MPKVKNVKKDLQLNYKFKTPKQSIMIRKHF